MRERLAAIDVGSNTVTSVVAEADGARWRPLHQRAVITRLGRGVGATGRLSSEALADTRAVLEAEVARARSLGAARVEAVATAAAREAANADALVEAAGELGLPLRIISGEEEAGLSWRAAWHDFGTPGTPLTVVDIGGRSTEVIRGAGPGIGFRVSLPVGAVGLTESRLARRVEAPEPAERHAVERDARDAFSGLPDALTQGRVVAVAGTATTLMAVHLGLPAYDPERVHGAELPRSVLRALSDELWTLSLAERKALPGMEPGRADVLPAGAAILMAALVRLGAAAVTVSDRGVRWGLLYDMATGDASR